MNLENVREGITSMEMRLVVREFVLEFAEGVSEAAEEIIATSSDPGVRLNAARWRLSAVDEVLAAGMRHEPVVGVIDVWVLCEQQRRFLAPGGAGAGVFGDRQAVAVAMSEELVAGMEAMALGFTKNGDLTEGRIAVDDFVRANPITDLRYNRQSVYEIFEGRDLQLNTPIDAVVAIEDEVNDIASQMRFHLASLPQRIRWEVEFVAAEMLEQEAVGLLLEDAHRASLAADRAASTVELLPAVIDEEVDTLLEGIGAERRATLEAIREERVATVLALREEAAALRGVVATETATTRDLLTAERAAALAEVDRQRLATIEAVREERAVIVGAVAEIAAVERAALGRELATTVDDAVAAAETSARAVVDHALLRILIAVVAAVVLWPLVAHMYARVLPARSS